MLGFPLGLWDYVTFAVLFLLGGAALAAAVLLLGLPGRIGDRYSTLLCRGTSMDQGRSRQTRPDAGSSEARAR
jgi:hypothetical protein